MRIDCHCHVFNHDAVPVKGLLESRFGIAVGRRLIDCINAARKEGRVPLLDELIKPIQLDVDALIDTFTDPAEKDSIRYLAGHPRGFLRFALAGMGRIADITAAMMEKAADDIDLWVPLMMDMECAYEGSCSLLGFDDQKRIMMDVTVQAGGRIMPFYAYDPRSRAVDDVKTAIEEEGFIGVKLYPPLGFKPWDNADGTVNDHLDDLYRYCSTGTDRPIPITAHCSWSDGITSNRAVAGVHHIRDYYRNLADPVHWEPVLARHKTLKLNLAHFGGAGEWEEMAVAGSPVRPDRRWAETIVRLMRDYEHVYTDLSFHGILAARNQKAYRRVLREMIHGVEDRILLGSDWYMSALQCNLADYWSNFETLLDELFDVATVDNPRRFLLSAATETFFPAFLSLRCGKDGWTDVFHQE